MAVELRKLYAQYVEYYSSFRTDFDTRVGTPLAKKFRSPILDFAEFRVIWEGWCRSGLEKSWTDRFERGYVHHTAESTRRFCKALENVEAGAGLRSHSDAA